MSLTGAVCALEPPTCLSSSFAVGPFASHTLSHLGPVSFSDPQRPPLSAEGLAQASHWSRPRDLPPSARSHLLGSLAAPDHLPLTCGACSLGNSYVKWVTRRFDRLAIPPVQAVKLRVNDCPGKPLRNVHGVRRVGGGGHSEPGGALCPVCSLRPSWRCPPICCLSEFSASRLPCPGPWLSSPSHRGRCSLLFARASPPPLLASTSSAASSRSLP